MTNGNGHKNGSNGNGKTNGNGNGHKTCASNGSKTLEFKPDSSNQDKQAHIKDAVCTLMEGGMQVIDHVCKEVGIGRDTFYRWFRDDKVFRDRVEASQTIRVKIVVDELYKLACSGDLGAIIFLLCNRDRENWSNPRNVTDHNHKGDILVKVQHVDVKQGG